MGGFLGGVCKTILNVKKSDASQVNLNSWIGGIPGLAGRIFLRRLLNTTHSLDGLSDHIHITDETLKDISWWQTFAQSWNGIAFFLDSNWTHCP